MMKSTILYLLGILITLTVSVNSENPSDTISKNELAYKRRICGAAAVDHDEEDYRIDKASNQCSSVLRGDNTHCGINMSFYPEEDNTLYGFCDCRSANYRGIFIYHKRSSRCYQIFTQAYCPSGKWLSLKQPTGQPICKDNPCRHNPEAQNSTDFFVELNGSCAELWEPAPGCGEREIVIFRHNKIFPGCSVYQPSTTRAPSVFRPAPNLASCGPGTLRSLTGKCQKDWEW